VDIRESMSDIRAAEITFDGLFSTRKTLLNRLWCAMKKEKDRILQLQLQQKLDYIKEIKEVKCPLRVSYCKPIIDCVT